MSQVFTWLTEFLTFSVWTVDGYSVTVGFAIGVGLIAMAVGAVVDFIGARGRR